MSQINGIYVDEEGNIQCRLGDSGTIGITGLPKDDDYAVTLGVYDPKTKEILAETTVQSDEKHEVEMPISVSFTESLGVGRFFYGIKLTDSEGQEQTVIPNSFMDNEGHITMGVPQTFTVKPKLVEGASV